MRVMRQLGPSVLFAAISLLLTIGVLSTALAEKRIAQSQPAKSASSLPMSGPTTAPSQTLSTPTLLPSANIISSPTHSVTIPAPTSPRIYTPTTSAGLTLTLIPCGVPAGWITYTVKSGDNLYRIGLAYRVSVTDLQSANCLGYSTRIIVGKNIYVPNVPTSTPAITNTLTRTATHTSTSTTQPPTLTSTATPTFTATLALSTETPTPTNTATVSYSPTSTLTPAP
ncbi:MAG: LysM peptidoglycan-binding domain-containing protein [Anaerolineales bacterium]|uniref:LysM peptidoglycan-binding domain-containing protein n=1 Tax=Candidatus Desulfolinea nitratireducens TaxID=2841698 RepID=A0A8J6TI96_9CHLR|nr:LysM peptidoglycan-binding domain-containing protein [Candidatus Desulfolinea nitratireducens]